MTVFFGVRILLVYDYSVILKETSDLLPGHIIRHQEVKIDSAATLRNIENHSDADVGNGDTRVTNVNNKQKTSNDDVEEIERADEG